jgi:hypothetical protein
VGRVVGAIRRAGAGTTGGVDQRDLRIWSAPAEMHRGEHARGTTTHDRDAHHGGRLYLERGAVLNRADVFIWRYALVSTARSRDASGQAGRPGSPLLGPSRPVVLGHDIGDLGLHMRLGASRIRLPGRQQLDDVKALQTA